jgi:hypothetical protein
MMHIHTGDLLPSDGVSQISEVGMSSLHEQKVVKIVAVGDSEVVETITIRMVNTHHTFSQTATIHNIQMDMLDDRPLDPIVHLFKVVHITNTLFLLRVAVGAATHAHSRYQTVRYIPASQMVVRVNIFLHHCRLPICTTTPNLCSL